MDYEAGSLTVSEGPEITGLFWDNVICVKCFLDKDSESDNIDLTDSDLPIYRMTIMGNQLKREDDGDARVVQTFAGELERIKAIREIFGIDISDDAAAHIRGRSAAIWDDSPQN